MQQFFDQQPSQQSQSQPQTQPPSQQSQNGFPASNFPPNQQISSSYNGPSSGPNPFLSPNFRQNGLTRFGMSESESFDGLQSPPISTQTQGFHNFMDPRMSGYDP